MLTAYDYDKQKWVTGEEARAVRIAQLRAELEILRGPDAAAFIAFEKRKGPVAREIAAERNGGAK